MQALPTLAREQLQLLQHQPAAVHRGVSIAAITGLDIGPPLSSAVSALRDGTLIVTELPGEARVPELEARNDGPYAILLVPGFELLGGLQNRVVNAPVVIKPGISLRVPCSCLEEGRWGSARGNTSFTSKGRTVPPILRHSLYRSSGASLMSRRDRRSDQGEVWREIDRESTRSRVRSRTSALSDVLDAQEHRQGATEPWPTVPRQVGAFASLGVSRGLEVFSSSDGFEQQGRATLDAFARVAEGSPAAPPELQVDQTAHDLLKNIGEAEWSPHAGVGAGTEYRATIGTFEAVALVLDESLVYLSAVAVESEGVR